MTYFPFAITPVQHAMSTQDPQLFLQPGFSPWVLNGRIDKGAFEKRWGYNTYRNLGSHEIQAIALYQKSDGSRYTLYLTKTDAMKRESGDVNAWSYITDTYTTGTIASLDVTKKVVTGSSTAWSTSGVAAGDQFIIDDDHDSDGEGVAQPWATVASVGAGEVTLNLDPAYTGASTSGTYKIRKVYAVPANERWQYAMVNDVFCFTNAADDVQKYTGTGYASALDSTNAKRARHCISYDDRLILGDFYLSTTRYPYTIKWCELFDPTHWDTGTYPTAGEKDFIETEDYLTGFGRVGANLVVFKEDSFYIGSRTGTATSPFEFPTHRIGIGNIAPYGIIEFMGTCAWVGRDNFWIMNGDQEEPIGEPIRHKFFDIVGESEVKKVWGASNALEHEISWTANTSEGRYTFTWNWFHNEWYCYSFAHSIISMGRGAV